MPTTILNNLYELREDLLRQLVLSSGSEKAELLARIIEIDDLIGSEESGITVDKNNTAKYKKAAVSAPCIPDPAGYFCRPTRRFYVTRCFSAIFEVNPAVRINPAVWLVK